MKTQKLIHEFDLEGTLRKQGVLERIEKGRLICFACDEIITDWRKIAIIIRVHNKFEYVCDKPDCIFRASKSSQEIK